MASFHTSIIKSVDSLDAGKTYHFTWNNPPGVIISYTATPDPIGAIGPHGTATGQVEVTRVLRTYTQDNYNSDSSSATIYIKNTGGSATGFDVHQNWWA